MSTPKQYNRLAEDVSRAELDVVVGKLMSGLPVKVTAYSIRPEEGCNVSQLIEAGKRCLSYEKESTVRMRFLLGDIWRAIVKMHVGDKKKDALPAICAAFGEVTYKQMKGYAWVAGKWSAPKRNNSRPWSWWRDHEPGEEGEVVKKPSSHKKEMDLRAAYAAGQSSVEFAAWFKDRFKKEPELPIYDETETVGDEEEVSSIECGWDASMDWDQSLTQEERMRERYGEENDSKIL